MKTLKVIIKRSLDHFAAYALDVWDIAGAGETPTDTKQLALD